MDVSLDREVRGHIFFYLKSKFISKLLLYYLKSLFRDTEWTFGDTERPFRVTERTFGDTEQRLYMPTSIQYYAIQYVII